MPGVHVYLIDNVPYSRMRRKVGYLAEMVE
jgi:hypothetical protein